MRVIPSQAYRNERRDSRFKWPRQNLAAKGYFREIVMVVSREWLASSARHGDLGKKGYVAGALYERAC